MNTSMSITRTPYQISTGKNQIRAFVAALIVAAALPGCADFPRSSNMNVDQKITTDVETSFGQHAALEPPNLLRVQTINRVVYLNGTVATGLQRDDAALVANQVQGVEKVVNSIAVSR
jgi:osmotically-inducible protein OsmY